MNFRFDKNLYGEVTIMNEYKQNCYNALCTISYEISHVDIDENMVGYVLYLYVDTLLGPVDDI